MPPEAGLRLALYPVLVALAEHLLLRHPRCPYSYEPKQPVPQS
jgi:hypothetical protein